MRLAQSSEMGKTPENVPPPSYIYLTGRYSGSAVVSFLGSVFVRFRLAVIRSHPITVNTQRLGNHVALKAIIGHGEDYLFRLGV
jgi:hypothetical protein